MRPDTTFARRVTELARAKVNLTLEVLGRRTDGYHELVSLVAFASIGDRLVLTEAGSWSLACAGPMAGAITGQNLVDRAAKAVRAVWPTSATGRLELNKVLPVAGGIGGGSADAAATLRALKLLNPQLPGDADWMALANKLGADVSVCFASRLMFIRGVGERLQPVQLDVQLPAVLVNPGTLLSTARVFAELAASDLREAIPSQKLPEFRDRSELLDWVGASRNDLEPPASHLAPAVGRVRTALLATQGCRLARMSGSGPTCFGLYDTGNDAAAAAHVIANEHPNWWVQATQLS